MQLGPDPAVVCFAELLPFACRQRSCWRAVLPPRYLCMDEGVDKALAPLTSVFRPLTAGPPRIRGLDGPYMSPSRTKSRALLSGQQPKNAGASIRADGEPTSTGTGTVPYRYRYPVPGTITCSL